MRENKSFLTNNQVSDVKRKILTLLILPLGLLSLNACTKTQAAPPPRPPVPIQAGIAAQKDVPVEVGAVGNVEAFSTVTVKSLVPGEILKVYFTEGQDVKKGAPLFLIDPRQLREALMQAESTLAKDTVQMKNAEVDAKRYKDLYGKGYVSMDQFDQTRTLAETLKGVVDADEAVVRDAKVKLGYSTIRSPLDARTGNLAVHQGNIVKDNDTQLVTLNQITPIKVDFSVPEKFLPQIKRYMASGSLRVRAEIPGDTAPAPEGRLIFINNTVDTATGTILLKALFPNADKRLWPGQFINAVLTLTVERGATVVPTQAVQSGQDGQFLFVIKPDMTVEQRPVVVDRELDGLTVISKGVSPGERIVTDGQMRLMTGAKVAIKSGV